ncbi:type II secretion system protein [Prosthecobacter dejongeii]|uniref:Prepilin-type N-terminal cleavage/methylation domain-containing protein n=1 Tax=Prosthecobacter dejongeii TaxID=48465 RepID=A0A7W7YLB9_9BACT|nr:prepilin-type N-terminal cleavage/methylation domain-containing protein [Prosthecobacter dejongeii]MBB5038199.1 prepilin-type N-terminal cleavage/methylation domain-containing protein [Prosthecobacter dejongeii]
MKKVNLNASLKAGFSLVEMLVVIAIIGIIAAIAIPNIGNINDSAKQATAQRNAQSVASVMNAAIAAGYVPAWATEAEVLAAAQGVTVFPATGPFKDKVFTVGNIDDEEEAAVLTYMDWDNVNKQVKYIARDDG